jgi:hypothetical protein
MEWPWFVLGGVGISGVVILLWRPLRGFGREIQAERARESFVLQRELLEAQFFQAASTSGKPRGLRWSKCEFNPSMELALDRQSRQIVALVPVTFQFEAVEGSDMEGLPAVANQRCASAVFFFERGQWRTAGRAVFNLNPAEALDHFKNVYERIQQK